MKIRILALAIAGLFGGALQASTVVSCGWSSAALNSCVSGGLTNFRTQLDWAAFGSPDGAVHTALWTAVSNGVTLTVSDQNASSGEGARSAYNYGAFKDSGVWYNYGQGLITTPFNFQGHFNSQTDTNLTDPIGPDSPYGDHLMGFAGSNANVANKSLVIDFGDYMNTVGFRIAAITSTSFNVGVQFFTGVNGTGTSIGGLHTFTSLSGGGICTTDRSASGAAPVPCNDAPFIAALQLQSAHSMVVYTNDQNGFYLGDLFVTEVPEPSPMIFAGCGLLLLVLGKKRLGRA